MTHPDGTIHRGDCRVVLASLPAESVDAVVCDPPYELNFMGRGWDNAGVAFEKRTWAECFRVLKPGGHLLAFGGTRTSHRMVCAIEDAGFEIRDSVIWMYGTGFPKSLDVSKAIDKAAGAERVVVGPPMRHGGGTNSVYAQDAWTIQNQATMGAQTAPASPEAEQWSGWGTALKPAHEPIVVARKPLIGTVAANVLAHGTGALNIDGCRVGTTGATTRSHQSEFQHDGEQGQVHATRGYRTGHEVVPLDTGRWPANVILSHSLGCELVGERVLKGDPRTTGDGTRPGGFANVGAASGDHAPNAAVYGDQVVEAYRCVPGCPVARLDEQSGQSKSTGGRVANISKTSTGGAGLGQDLSAAAVRGDPGFGDTGGASRFFYCAKASKAERGEGNLHPTVKPIALMRYLVRLVTPPGGTVCDPFMGSGTTAVACVEEGFDFIGIEENLEYFAIARSRIGHALVKSRQAHPDLWALPGLPV